MAGDWIKWEKGLYRKPEVLQLASLLGIDRLQAAARCMLFWEWADEVTVAGEVPGITVEALDEIAGITGFGAALEKVGWVTASPTGLTLPNFQRHNGESAKKRALKADRQRRWRAE